MARDAFSDVTTWVFDLDHTLYPPHMALFDQIEHRMTQYVMRTLGVDAQHADTLRARYWAEYGTTLAGLMRVHDIDPDPYLDEVHDVDFSPLLPDPDLRASIAALPGRRIIYTNGSAPYARRVIEARGLSGLFDAIYGIEHAGYAPKPERAAFDSIFAQDGLTPVRAAMFEDDPRNLVVPRSLGLRTVLVGPESPAPGEPHPHVDFRTADLTGFLRSLLG